MKLLCKITLVLMFFCFYATSDSAEINLVSYVNNINNINDLAIHNQYIWCATSGGVVYWDLQTISNRTFGGNDGLPSDNINCIAVDNEGLVWAGTDKGISYYDGLIWKSFTIFDGLPGNNVSSIEIGPDGTVWAITNNNISYYDGINWKIFEFPLSILPYSIAISPHNEIWVARYHPSRFDGTSWEHYVDIKGRENVRPRLIIEAIAIAADSIVYVGTSPYLHRYKPNSINPFSNWGKLRPFNGSDGIIYDIAIDSNSLPWIAYGGAALKYYDSIEWINISVPFPSVGSIKTIAISNDGVVYAGSSNGVYRYANDEWTKLKIKTGLIHNYINTIAIAPYDIVWVGTVDGLSKFDGTTWDSFDSDDGLPSNNISQLAVSPGGEVWVGTRTGNYDFEGTGISTYDGVNWTTFTTDNGLPGNYCSALAIGPDGTVWAGTSTRVELVEDGYWYEGKGLSKYDGNKWETFTSEDGLPKTSYIKSIAIGQTGIVILSTRYAIFEYDGTYWTETLNHQGYGGDVLYNAYNDVIWIGNRDSIQRYYVNGRWGTPNIEVKRASSFALSSDNILWVGSRHYLHRIEGTKHEIIDLENWKAYNMPIALDSHDVLWVGTGKGLLRIQEPDPTIVNSNTLIPSRFSITGNYPNPFNLETTISFTLPSQDKIHLSIYNSMGQKVRDLISENMQAGKHTIAWDGRNDHGEAVSSGLYISRLRNSSAARSNKMLLLK